MEQYKIRQGGFKEIRKQALIRSLPIMLISAIVGIAISTVNSKQKESTADVLPIVIPIIVVSVGFGMYRGLGRQKAIFDSYILTLTNNLITREQLNTPTISIYFKEIREIVKNKNGSFTIRGKAATDLIGVPAQIENYLQLETSLNQIKPIATKSGQSFLKKYQFMLVFLVLGSMLCVYTVTNKIIVAFTGALTIIILLWSFYEVRQSKNVDVKTKQGIWWVLIVLASVIAVMIMKLTGQWKT